MDLQLNGVDFSGHQGFNFIFNLGATTYRQKDSIRCVKFSGKDIRKVRISYGMSNEV